MQKFRVKSTDGLINTIVYLCDGLIQVLKASKSYTQENEIEYEALKKAVKKVFGEQAYFVGDYYSTAYVGKIIYFNESSKLETDKITIYVIG